MYSTPAQPVLPYAFKPRNYVIRFYSVFIPFVHPQVFPVKFFKRFTRFSPIFPNFLSYNQLYIYIRITNDSLVQKNFLATICLWCRILYTFLGCSALRIHSVQFVLYKSRVVATKRNEFLTFFYLCVVENDSWRKEEGWSARRVRLKKIYDARCHYITRFTESKGALSPLPLPVVGMDFRANMFASSGRAYERINIELVLEIGNRPRHLPRDRFLIPRS